jgi:hypothetical protein
MEMEYTFRYPMAETASLTFPEALKVMVDSKDFFRQNGFENYKPSTRFGFDARKGLENVLDQGMYELRTSSYDETKWCMENKLAFPDGSKMNAMNFAGFDDIDGLMRNMIRRGAKIEANMPVKPQIIKTEMKKSFFEYSAHFYISTKPLVKGFFNKEYHDLDIWEYRCYLKLDQSYIDEAKAQEFNNLKDRFQAFLLDYASRANELNNDLGENDQRDNQFRNSDDNTIIH